MLFVRRASCYFEVLRRTDCRKVISFSVFGRECYVVGAIKNMLLQPQIYPDWVCRFYVSRSVPEGAVQRLLEGGEVFRMLGDWRGLSGTTWRFMVCGDFGVDRFLCRDADSRLSHREAVAVAEWEASVYPVHRICDYGAHLGSMLAGTWGGVRGVFPEILNILPELQACVSYGDDEQLLDRRVFRKYLHHHMVHTFGPKEQYGDSRILTVPGHYVGAVVKW